MRPIDKQKTYRVAFMCRGKWENKNIQIPEDTPEDEVFGELQNVIADNRSVGMHEVSIVGTDPECKRPTADGKAGKPKNLTPQELAKMTKGQLMQAAASFGCDLNPKARLSQMVTALSEHLGFSDNVQDSEVTGELASTAV